MFSYHTHSLFCDGKASIAEFCETAIENRFFQLAFTAHAPVPFANNYSLAFDKLFEYRHEVMRAKQQYANDIEILLGLEADYIPNTSIDFDQWRKLIDPDFIVGSVHFVRDADSGLDWFIDGDPKYFEIGLKEVLNGDVKKGVLAYFAQVRQMIETQRPDIVGHIDKVKMNNRDIYFFPTDDWYMAELVKTILSVKKYGGIVEINPRGIYRGKYHQCFPHIDGIKLCMEHGIPMTLASDAHHPTELTQGFNLSLNAAKDAGLNEVSIFDKKAWRKVGIDSLPFINQNNYHI